MAKGLKIAGCGVLVLAIFIAAIALSLFSRDPVASLPVPEHGLTAQVQAAVSEGRTIQHVTLPGKRLGDINFLVSLPDPLPSRKLPLVIVLGGIKNGEDNLRHVTAIGDHAVIGYDWPVSVHFYGRPNFWGQIPSLYLQIMTIPAQVTTAINWLADQPWPDPQRMSLLGFSLGAVAAPAIQDIATRDGTNIRWAILAYGGTPFGALVTNNPHVYPPWMRSVLAPVIDCLLSPLEPTQHLSHLSGHFLILQGQDDTLMPEAARRCLREATPEPKTIVTFGGNHMGVGKEKMVLLQKIIATSRVWLIENGAINA